MKNKFFNCLMIFCISLILCCSFDVFAAADVYPTTSGTNCMNTALEYDLPELPPAPNGEQYFHIYYDDTEPRIFKVYYSSSPLVLDNYWSLNAGGYIYASKERSVPYYMIYPDIQSEWSTVYYEDEPRFYMTDSNDNIVATTPYSNYIIRNEDNDVVFQKAPTSLGAIITINQMKAVLKQVVCLLPCLLSCLIGFLALRKAWAWLKKQLVMA